jgi:hypothetical protein
MTAAEAEALVTSRVSSLLTLLYMARLFEVEVVEGRPTYGQQMERSAALSWDSFHATPGAVPQVRPRGNGVALGAF